MDSFFEKLLVTSLKTTCQIHNDTEMSFSEFYDKYRNVIFTHFEIENPSEVEFVLAKQAFLNSSNDPCSFKSLVFEMSQVEDMDNVEELAFTCIVIVVTSVVKNHRALAGKPVVENLDLELNWWAVSIPITVGIAASLFYYFSK